MASAVYQLYVLILVTVIIQYKWAQVTAADTHSPLIKFLPGFPGPLPFRFQTGYVGVDESEDVQLFYYFVESQRNPREDPLLLWLTGGPGCSSFCGFALGIGPLYFEEVVYNGTLPTLFMNPNRWTKVASVIFLDFPVGTGFSYGRTPFASGSTDDQACAQAAQFLRKWFVSHPEFLSNPFYVAGDSYAGMFIPVITQIISNGNQAGLKPAINLKGYIAGNPATFPAQLNFTIPFSHGMGLISDELFESLRRSCGFDDQKPDPDSAECSLSLEAFEQCTAGLNEHHILWKNCDDGDAQRHLHRSLSGEKRAVTDIIGETSLLEPGCPVDAIALTLFKYWFNDMKVQEALHIRKGTVGTWERCSTDLSFEILISDVRPYHANLSTRGYRSLIYSGDHDPQVPFLSTQAWIRDLNYSIIDDWRPWILEGQYSGYTRTYSNKMTFATLKGGSHTPTSNRPAECYAMFERWISEKPL
ncbi:hypothetical protein ACET3Z_024069 [Daucus carota]